MPPYGLNSRKRVASGRKTVGSELVRTMMPLMKRCHSDVAVSGCANRERFLQWTLGKLFLTVEDLEDRQLICFSKRDAARRHSSGGRHVFVILLDVVLSPRL